LLYNFGQLSEKDNNLVSTQFAVAIVKEDEMDEALLVLRIVFALMVFGHATQKLFGWFRGKGIAGTGAIFETLGLKPGKLMVLSAGLLELAAAASIGLGLLTPLGAIALMGAMIVAAATLWHNGFWAHMGGMEVPFSYALLALILAWAGPGAYSADAILGIDFSAWWVAVGGLALAAIGSSPLVAMIQKKRRSQA
jgi:putative oxidoreductase